MTGRAGASPSLETSPSSEPTPSSEPSPSSEPTPSSDASAPDPDDLMRHDLMPGLRRRHDGFTAERTRVFLAVLGEKGCVRDACRVAGVTSTNAYRLKRRFPRFAAAWGRALDRGQQGLQAIAWQRAVEGKETIIIRNGREYERRISPDSSILALLMKQGRMGEDAGAALTMGVKPDDLLTRKEWDAGWRFHDDGGKFNEVAEAQARTDAMRAELTQRIGQMRSRMETANAAANAAVGAGEGAE